MTNKKLTRVLQNLELEEKEAEIYLVLLETGLSSVADIAKRTGIKRTTVYYILERLEKLGFCYQTVIENKSFYAPEKPDLVIKRYTDRVENLTESAAELNSIFANSNQTSSQVSFLNGEEGFKKIWQILFNSGIKEYQIITDPREMLGFVRKNYITGKIIQQKIKLGIKSRQILNCSEYAKEVVAKDAAENRVSKFLPYDKRIYFTKIIFGDNVAMISPNADEVIMLLYKNRFLAKSEKEIFETLWQLLPPMK